jgi:transposase
MAEIQSASAQRYCPKCQAAMELAPPVPGLGHFAHRIFECRKCGHIQIAPE